MNTRRILFLVDSCRDLCPGQFFRELLDAMPNESVEYSIGILDIPGNRRGLSYELPDCPLHFLGRRFTWDFGAAFQIRQIAHQENLSILHSWSGRANRIAKLAASWGARQWGIQELILTQSDFRKSANLFSGFKLGGCRTRVLTTHPSIEKRLLSSGYSAHQLFSIHMGAPLPPFSDISKKAPPQRELREALDLPEDLLLIGANADWVSWNRWKDLLWSVDLVQSVRDDFRFLVFGDGPQRWRLEKFAHQTEADRKTIFLGNHPDFLHWLRELDLFWHAYDYDPCPYAVVAALRAGCPVLAPRSQELAELIGDGGQTFELGKRDQIARITNSLFESPEQLGQLRENTQSLKHLVDIKQTAEELLELYDAA